MPTPFAPFVVTPESRSAFVAAHDLADALRHDTEAPNPLYLHGPPGTGKTCLVSALADAVCDRTDLAACTLSANAFPLPFADDAERLKTARRVNLLIVEDLQHLPARAVESFMHLLDERLQRHLPTVCTATAGPGQLAHRGNPLPGRLTSRLAAGLVVALEPLQAPSRLLLLQELANRHGLSIDAAILRWLADHLTGGRQLEGALHQVATLQKLQRRPLTLDEVRGHFGADTNRPTVERILRHVCTHFRVDVKQVHSPRRQRPLLLARQVGMYLARQLTPLSLHQIGAFGGRDHTTVLHACRKVEAAMRSDIVLQGTVHRLHAELT